MTMMSIDVWILEPSSTRFVFLKSRILNSKNDGSFSFLLSCLFSELPRGRLRFKFQTHSTTRPFSSLSLKNLWWWWYYKDDDQSMIGWMIRSDQIARDDNKAQRSFSKEKRRVKRKLKKRRARARHVRFTKLRRRRRHTKQLQKRLRDSNIYNSRASSPRERRTDREELKKKEKRERESVCVRTYSPSQKQEKKRSDCLGCNCTVVCVLRVWIFFWRHRCRKSNLFYISNERRRMKEKIFSKSASVCGMQKIFAKNKKQKNKKNNQKERKLFWQTTTTTEERERENFFKRGGTNN